MRKINSLSELHKRIQECAQEYVRKHHLPDPKLAGSKEPNTWKLLSCMGRFHLKKYYLTQVRKAAIIAIEQESVERVKARLLGLQTGEFYQCPYCHKRTYHERDVKYHYCPCCGFLSTPNIHCPCDIYARP